MKKTRRKPAKTMWLPFTVTMQRDNMLSPTEKLLIAIITLLDKEDGCFARNSVLAEYLNVSVPTVIKAINRLCELEYIIVNEKQKGRSNIRIVCDEIKIEMR
ncbi:MAG: helix-turn-helix domain-containing protein [Bacteroidota bacterium]